LNGDEKVFLRVINASQSHGKFKLLKCKELFERVGCVYDEVYSLLGIKKGQLKQVIT